MTDLRTRNNALSSYLLVWVCATFLFIKNNESINNDFVKSHTKTALFLQLFLLVNWFLFLHLWFFSSFSILNYWLNEIISIFFFLIIFWFMLFGMHKATKWEYFTIKDFSTMTKTENLVEIEENLEMSEKDKLTLILAHIPFVWFFVYWKYYDFRNSILENIVKLNSYSRAFIFIIYCLWHYNIANILVLFYILFVVFSGVQIVSSWTILNLNLKYLQDTNSYLISFKSFIKYIKNYFSNFRKFREIEVEMRLSQELKDKQDLEFLKTQRDLKVSPYLIYIPILNIMLSTFKDTKYQNHIENGYALSLFFAIVLILNYLWYVPSLWLLMFLFPISYGMSYIKRLEYRLAFIRDFYDLLWYIIKSILNLWKLAKSKHEEENEIKFRVKSEEKEENL